ncbi:hypothetical protein [Cellulosimicrobium funkei]|uniref:hypothetical protein n=1 Tax=Cellulosimicrobium funkei TaxID=264251 RepID=UPI0037DD82BE
MAAATRKIVARPAGRDRHGNPLREREFVIDRDPEHGFGSGRSRIFTENRSHRHPDGRVIFTPVVVITESIQDPADTTYVPRHRAEAAPTGKQTAREQIAAIRLRNGQPVRSNARHAIYRAGFVGPVPFTLSHPDDRLPLGLAATTGQEAA